MKRIALILFSLFILFISCSPRTSIFPETTCPEEGLFVSETENQSDDALNTGSEADTGKKEAETEKADSAEEIITALTLEEKVGQLFLARNPLTLAEGENLISDYHVGGIIFFGRDFKKSSPSEFKALIKKYNEVSELPLLTAVDEEGGTVCRASLYKAFREEKFASPAELYAEGGLELVLDDAAEKSKFLLELGLNFNLAPVADISTDEKDFIFERSLGLGRDETAEYVSEVVKVMNQKKILSALKHFPGYGNNEDTHTGIAYDKRSFESLLENDLVPFEAGIRAGASAVMVSHNIVEDIGPDMPASLSGKVMDILRQDMKFEGVIMTDDLSMDAIENFTESGEAAVLAVLAGSDLLCCSDTEAQYSAVLAAVKDGRISEERLNESVLRIISMKLEYGILN